ncbi:MAG: HD domain-containing phosphohydrolase, partial [Anaerolineaceae bacterium]
YKNEQINRVIWNSYFKIKRAHERSLEDTVKKARFFSGLKHLRRIHADWQAITAKEVELLEMIIQAPASLKYYNFKRSYDELRKQEQLSQENNERRFNDAYSALEMALGYVRDYINKRDFTSQVLDFDEALRIWTEKIHETVEQQKSRRVQIEELLRRMESLKNGIFEAPPMAKWIGGVEDRFTRLVKDHDLLEKAYQKTIIHSAELEDMKGILHDVVPHMWINGESEPLERYLKQLETFIGAHEPALQEELAYQERHRPWSANGDALKDADEIDMLTSFVQIMINAIEARESHMGDHSATVARLARLTAEELKWTEQEIKYLQIAGLMHDVGKIWIPDTLLTKTGPLSDHEMQVLRMHPYYSAKIVASIKMLKDIVPWVYNHHERWDGKGYPDGLRQNEIPLGASIIAVA